MDILGHLLLKDVYLLLPDHVSDLNCSPEDVSVSFNIRQDGVDSMVCKGSRIKRPVVKKNSCPCLLAGTQEATAWKGGGAVEQR